MKIEVGMYVRVKGKNNFPGGIAKVLKLEKVKKDTWLTLDKALDYSFLTSMTSIIKASYNIMDLIKKGDYVNGREVTDIFYDSNDEVIGISTIGSVDYINNQIKSIVKKEQFESMKYEVK